MFCKHCGAELPDDAKFCPNCGHTLTDDDPHTQTSPTTEPSDVGKNDICCPECGSRNLQYTTDTDFSTTVKTKGFSGSKGCLGYLMFGPLGILCGNCGSGKSTTTVNATTSHGWICRSCGHKFRDKKEIEEEIAKEASTARAYNKKTSITMSVVSLLLFLVLFFTFTHLLDYDSSDIGFWLLAIATVASPFIVYWIYSLIRTSATNRVGILKREIDELEKKMDRFR